MQDRAIFNTSYRYRSNGGTHHFKATKARQLCRFFNPTEKSGQLHLMVCDKKVRPFPLYILLDIDNYGNLKLRAEDRAYRKLCQL